MDHLTILAAGQAIDPHQVLGAVSMTGLALCSGTALVFGVRGSDVIKLRNKKTTGGFAVVTGSLFVAAGGTWADVIMKVHNVPTEIIGSGGFGDPGAGGTALFLTLCVIGPRWKRMIWPALFGLSAAVAWDQAGGSIGSILVNIIKMSILNVTGAH